MKIKTLEKSSEACVLMGKAARLSTGGQVTQVQNLCKRGLMRKASSFIAQFHILLPSSSIKSAFVFMVKG